MNGHLIKLLKTGINVKPLIDRIENSPELWQENTWRQNYTIEGERPISPQQDTEAIMFRWAPENTIDAVRDTTDVKIHKNLFDVHEVQPLIIECLTTVGALECGRVFITKLKPGGKVLPHCDYGNYSDRFERFHLVLTSDPGNRFYVQTVKGWCESSFMQPGEFFWFNHKETHWVVNESQTPRMHMIIDCISPNFRRERDPLLKYWKK